MSKKALPDFSAQAQSIEVGGIYEHYKGHQYKVIGVARHTETLEEMVVYHECGENEIWVRPLGMFLENIVIDGKTQPRFKPIS